MGGMIVPFLYGFLWMLFVGVQMRMYSEGTSMPAMFSWTLASSVLWCYMVRKVNIDKSSTWSYSIGTGVGAVVAMYFKM